MKRFCLTTSAAVIALLGLGSTGSAANLKPVPDCPPEYSGASGSVSIQTQKYWIYVGWDQQRVAAYQSWANYRFKGLAPRTDYFLNAVLTTGEVVWLGAFGTDDSGNAGGNGSIYSGKFPPVDHFELWSDTDPDPYQGPRAILGRLRGLARPQVAR